MRDKITVYGLLSKIYNGNTDMPKKICFCGYEYEWDNDFKDYLRTDNERQMTFSFLENHDDNLTYFLEDTVDIIEEDFPTVSEEQVLFNELSYENQQFILKQMRLLQPCKLKENK